MTQVPFVPRLHADIPQESESESEIKRPSPLGAAFPGSFSLTGAHSVVRGEMAYVNRLLASDETRFVSKTSVYALRRALSDFLKDVRSQASAEVGLGVFTGADTHFRSGGSRQATPRTRRPKTDSRGNRNVNRGQGAA